MVLKGIGEKTAERFKAAGIFTVNDLLEYYPIRYEIYELPGSAGDKADGRITAVCGFIEGNTALRRAGKLTIVSGRVRTQTETIQVIWFQMPYLQSSLKPGKKYVLRGRVKHRGKTVQLQQPQLFDPEDYQRKCISLQPVYSQIKGISNNMLRKSISLALTGLYGSYDACENAVRDPGQEDLAPELLEKYHLLSLSKAQWEMHFPRDEESMRLARNRLVFDEFLLFLMTVRIMRSQMTVALRTDILHRTGEEGKLINALPYSLTNAQRAAWETIRKEMTSPHIMTRLVQGDVGCGKTVIAFLAMITAAGNGAQCAMMAPTEVLASQHYQAFRKLCRDAGLDIPAALLTGAVTALEKRNIKKEIASGKILVVIGTHALIQQGVSFQRLALVITDEQHRFGVHQRELLSEKGEMPHTMVMSATPIPRTLAAILFGDLDITVIDELPGGRIKVKNALVGKAWRPNAYEFIRREVQKGHQAYVICPLVDSSELVDAENVTDYADILRNVLGEDIRVGVLHGRMKNAQKIQVMEAFQKNEIQVLVSTTVVEVGVNVPNATVMMIENAERFGLAQLHQLRGRVGRGKDASYCIFVCGQETEENHERLEILVNSSDGFEVAQKDLGLRGPGDLLGIRQSGEARFAIADIYRDADILKMADEAASDYYDNIMTKQEKQFEWFIHKLHLYRQEKAKKMNI